MQSHATWGLIAQNNYWVLNPHNDCFINNSCFKCWLHIYFPQELCRGNNSLKLSLFLSCGTDRKGCRVGVTGWEQQDRWAGSLSLHLGGHGPTKGVWTWVGLAESMSQTFSFKAGMAEFCCLAKPVSKGCWRRRGEAGFPIKGKGV